MARTIRSVILATLNSRAYQDEEITAGDLFWYAEREKNYSGTKERLLSRAEDLVRQGVIGRKREGRGTVRYTRFAQSRPKCTGQGLDPEVLDDLHKRSLTEGLKHRD